MATIRDVARKARVSVGTVSHVFSGVIPVSPELRSRVIAVANQLNFNPSHVARSLSVKRTNTLGMVITDITNPFFPQVVRGAEDVALRQDYLLITINTNEQLDRERQVLSVLRSRRVDGILLVVAPNGGDVAHIRTTLEADIPIVCIDRVPSGITLDSVSVDNVKGAQSCVRHLIEQGHRRIAIITGSLSLENAQGRLRGYHLALRAAGIEPDPYLTMKGDFREATGYRLGKELLLRHDRPTAVFLSNGVMTMGFLRALYETGQTCPGDIAFATFDDPQPAAIFRPQITAVAQPAYEIGSAAAELLIQRVQGKVKSSKRLAIRLEPELRIRESSSGRMGDTSPQSLLFRPGHREDGRDRDQPWGYLSRP
jgi:LacI family transcriptional regulator